MVRVTAPAGQIMSGRIVLGIVARGTRLWAFSTQPGWHEVKLPGKEQHGWLAASQAEAVRLTEQEQQRLQTAESHFERHKSLRQNQKLKEATREYKTYSLIVGEVLGEDHPGFALTLSHLGVLASEQGDYATAKTYFKQALAICRKMLGNEHVQTAGMLNNLGSDAFNMADYRAAREYYEESLRITRKLRGTDHQDVALTLGNLGAVAISQKDYASARKYLEDSLAIYRKTLGDEHAEMLRPLANLGNLAREVGDFKSAKAHYEDLLHLSQKVLGKQHTTTAMALDNLGALVQDRGDYAAAQQYYNESLAICRRVLGDRHPQTANVLANLGVLARQQQNYPVALKHLSEALAVFRDVLGNQHTETAYALHELGVLHEDLEDAATARRCYEEALAIKRKTLGNSHPSTADTLGNLGSLTGRLGDYSSARRSLEESLAIYQKTVGEAHPRTAVIFHNLGRLAEESGDHVAAQGHYERSLSIGRKALGDNHPNTASTLNSLGILAKSRKDFTSARKYYDEALVICRNVFGEQHNQTGDTLGNLGVLAYEERDFATARKYYENALRIYRSILGNEDTRIARTLVNLAGVAIEEGNPAGAAIYLDEARRSTRFYQIRTLPALLENEQTAFLEHIHRGNWTAALSFGLWEQADPRVAFLSAGWLINGKAVGQEAMAEAALLQRPAAADLLSGLRSVRAKLAQAALKRQSPQRDQELATLEEQRQQLHRELARIRGTDGNLDPWIEIDLLRRAIPAQSVLVSLARFAPYDFTARRRNPPHYVAWVIPPANQGNVQVVDLGEAEPIDAAVTAFREEMAQTEQTILDEGEKEAAATAEKLLQPLAESIIQPLLPKLGLAKELILSPDGLLWLVPWAAVPLSKDELLIERYQLRYVVSGRELVPSHVTAARQQSVVIADPNYDLAGSQHLASADNKPSRRSQTRLRRAERLSGTAREAEAIRDSVTRYSGGTPAIYLDDNATEDQFKQLTGPRVLVLATHGFFLADQEVRQTGEPDGLGFLTDFRLMPSAQVRPIENPLLRCGLLLAGCNRAGNESDHEDGVLTGLEIVGSDLRGTELVVLSACDTGIGDVRNGEGVAGLRQAFQLAGAKSVMATLWQIPDTETATLMDDFFSCLANGATKAEALRQAQRKRIAEHRQSSGAAHPYFWAAFTLTGD